MEEGALEEAEFYNIKTLIQLVKERIHERDQRKLDDVNFGRQIHDWNFCLGYQPSCLSSDSM